MGYVFELLIVLAIAGAALLCLYRLAWLVLGRREYSEEKVVAAKIIAVKFSPEKHSSHIGTGLGMNGQLTTMVVDDSEEEQDIVLLRSEETGRIQIDNANLLDNVSQGEAVLLTYQEEYTFWCWDRLNKKLDKYTPVSVRTSKGKEIKV